MVYVGGFKVNKNKITLTNDLVFGSCFSCLFAFIVIYWDICEFLDICEDGSRKEYFISLFIVGLLATILGRITREWANNEQD